MILVYNVCKMLPRIISFNAIFAINGILIINLIIIINDILYATVSRKYYVYYE